MNYKAVHPFPARMAPEIAFEVIKNLRKNSLLLDPMMGSGTSLRIGLASNYNCIGADIDPLAILISKVSNTYLKKEMVVATLSTLLRRAKNRKYLKSKYWDKETEEFAKFWFGEQQLHDLSILSKCISELEKSELRNFFQVAISRCIITKDKGASLARDVSHAKPHRTRIQNDYDVFDGLEQNVNVMLQRSLPIKPTASLAIYHNDARCLENVEDKSIDCIITSPPYLHAVDYFRGHRLSLIWLGYTLKSLKALRSKSIGIRKNPDLNNPGLLKEILKGTGALKQLSNNHRNHLNRYGYDCYAICEEFSRVLKKGKKATMVIADALSDGVFINNTRLLKNSAYIAGLKLLNETIRSIPASKRYLPPPEYLTNSDLDKRMKTEAILTFIK
jgi:DNA modification methylase